MSKYFKGVNSYKELKETYRKLLKENHPDNGGNVETMQDINIEYDALFTIWKNKEEQQTGETIKETASSTRRTFYTAYGWAGSRYDSKLSLKEIAKIVRAYVKEKYPTCKFSVRTSYASMCQELHASILEFPAQMYKTGDDLRKEGLYKHVVCDDGYEYDTYTDEVEEMWRKLNKNGYFDKTSWNDEDLIQAYEETIKNSVFYAIKTEYFASVINDVEAFIESYNYDDSDAMTDYFDNNFYFFGVKESDCKQVEKIARIKNTKNKVKAEQPQPQTEELQQIEDNANKLTFKITAGEDTRDFSELWIVRINETLTKERYIDVNNQIKKMGGYYSKYKHGFIFRIEPSELLKEVI